MFQNMDSVQMIKATSLQITGLFARLKSGRLNTDQAMDMVLSLTDRIDTEADKLGQANKQLRFSNAKHQKNILELKQQEEVIRAKIHELQYNLNSSEDAFSTAFGGEEDLADPHENVWDETVDDNSTEENKAAEPVNNAADNVNNDTK